MLRSLAPSRSTLVVMSPAWGVTRQTVQATELLAEDQRRAHVEVGLDRSAVTRARRVNDRGTVLGADLKVTPKAREALRNAHARFGKGEEAGSASGARALSTTQSHSLNISAGLAQSYQTTMSVWAIRLDGAGRRFNAFLTYWLRAPE